MAIGDSLVIDEPDTFDVDYDDGTTITFPTLSAFPAHAGNKIMVNIGDVDSWDSTNLVANLISEDGLLTIVAGGYVDWTQSPPVPVGTSSGTYTLPLTAYPSGTAAGATVNGVVQGYNLNYHGCYVEVPFSLNLEEEGFADLEDAYDIDPIKDPHTSEYPITAQGGHQGIHGGHIKSGAVGRDHKHHHNWENGHLINTQFSTAFDIGAITELLVGPNTTKTGYVNIPQFAPDGTIPGGRITFGDGSQISAPVQIVQGTPASWPTVVISGTAGTVSSTGLYQGQWPHKAVAADGPQGAYVLLDYVTNSTSNTGAGLKPTWYTAAPGTDLSADAFVGKIKVGVMSTSPDSSGLYYFHPAQGATSGTGPQGVLPSGYGLLTREQDYPHKPHKWEMDGFHFEFDPAASVPSLLYSSGTNDVNTGYTDNVVIMPNQSGEPPGITQFSVDSNGNVQQTTKNLFRGTANYNNASVLDGNLNIHFLARPNYYVVVNMGSGTATLSGNMIAEQAIATGAPNTGGNPNSYTLQVGEIRCAYYHPGTNNPDVLVIGRISRTHDKTINSVSPNGYLFIRGWHHGNGINPDHIPPNIFVRENDYPSDWGRFRHTGFHFELAFPSDTTTNDSSGDPVYNGKRIYTSNVYIIKEQDTANNTFFTPTVEIYDPSKTVADSGENLTGGVAYQTVDNSVTNEGAAGTTAFVAKAGYHLVYNITGASITLGSPNVMAANDSSSSSNTILPSHRFAAVRYAPTNPGLAVFGQFSHKVDQLGYLFLVNSKHGVGLTSPYVIGNNKLPIEVDTQDKPHKYIFDNFHFEFDQSLGTTTGASVTTRGATVTTAGISPVVNVIPTGWVAGTKVQDTVATVDVNGNVVAGNINTISSISGNTLNFPATWTNNPALNDTLIAATTITLMLDVAGQTRKISFPQTSDVSASVSNSSFQTFAGYWVVYNHTGATYTLPSGLTGEGGTTIAGSTASGIISGEIRAISVNPTTFNNADIWVIGKISPVVDTAGYLYMRGWHHAVFPAHYPAIPDGVLALEKLNPNNAIRWQLVGTTFTHAGVPGQANSVGPPPVITNQTISWLSAQAIDDQGNILGNIPSSTASYGGPLAIKAYDWIYYNNNAFSVSYGTQDTDGGSIITPAYSIGRSPNGSPPTGKNQKGRNIFWIGRVNNLFDSKSGLLWIKGFHVGLHQTGGDGIQTGSSDHTKMFFGDLSTWNALDSITVNSPTSSGNYNTTAKHTASFSFDATKYSALGMSEYQVATDVYVSSGATDANYGTSASGFPTSTYSQAKISIFNNGLVHSSVAGINNDSLANYGDPLSDSHGGNTTFGVIGVVIKGGTSPVITVTYQAQAGNNPNNTTSTYTVVPYIKFTGVA